MLTIAVLPSAIRSEIHTQRSSDDRGGVGLQREEAQQALAGPVQVDVVRAARMRRLGAPTTSGRGIPLSSIPEGGGENS